MKQVRIIFSDLLGGHTNELSTDKEYRKGVHWLETLRLRRVKILQAGYNVSLTYLNSPISWLTPQRLYRTIRVSHLAIQSLEQFVSEAGDIMRKALTIYVDAVS